AKLSVIPLLIKTQDKFISVIGAGAKTLDGLFSIIESSELPANLFVKHLSILADYGGEMLQRVSKEFGSLFHDDRLTFIWRGEVQTYVFRALPRRKLSNKALRIDGKELLKDHPLNDLQKDAIVLLMFGSAHSGSDEQASAALAKCEIGEYLGKPDELEKFVKQRYIWVSRITGGAQSNNLGQLAQKFVAKYLEDHLNLPNVQVIHGGRLPNVTHTDPRTERLTSFDLIVTNSQRYVAVEVSFQVTTNSVIERKAGQARPRFGQVKRAGHKIAYVLDGAGNFQRETALRTICAHSHCTVAFSRSELEVLCQFLREEFAR
ncbi:MAG: restriction endonuclease, partial [Anaerolineae bacterium]|nr:restriction endonuclease [Anaerolineae bacterium]